MRVVCRHGHYAFYPRDASDVQRFANFYNLDLVGERDYFTFRNLLRLPTYSLKGKAYGGVTALKTFSGMPWEVMQANDLVYDLGSGVIVKKESITQVINPMLTDFFYIAETVLVQAGSFLPTGQKILGFDGEFDILSNQLRVRSFKG